MTPTSDQIEAFLKKHGPSDMVKIAKHFDCLTEPTPNAAIRMAVWGAVGDCKVRMQRKGFKFEAGVPDLWP